MSLSTETSFGANHLEGYDGVKKRLEVYEEVSRGGEWLGAARRWLQSNVQHGDTMCWNDYTPVSIPFCKLEEFALRVAVAAVEEERRKQKK